MNDELEAALNALKAFEESDRRGRELMNKRRMDWPAAKTLAISVLKDLEKAADQEGRKLYVTSGGGPYENFDGVQIVFGTISTGVTIRKFEMDESGVEHGACLVFGQNESGLICVLKYPCLTQLPYENRQENEEIFVEAIEPSELSRERLLTIVSDFLSWAFTTSIRSSTSGQSRPIGFLGGARR